MTSLIAGLDMGCNPLSRLGPIQGQPVPGYTVLAEEALWVQWDASGERDRRPKRSVASRRQLLLLPVLVS